MIPWAIDDLIISDDVLWQSALKDAHGLPQSPAQLAERFGRWPAFGGLTRPGRRLSLVTLWNHATHGLRSAAKLAFEQYASPEREVVRRLMAVDSVVQGAAPSSVLLALGPWDVARSSNTYAPRNLLDPDTIGTVSGGVIWKAGRFGQAVQVAEATTNLFINPSIEIDTTGFAATTATLTRVTTQSYRGLASLQVESAGNDQGWYFTVTTQTAAATQYTFAIWLRGSGNVRLGWSGNTSGTTYGSAITLTSVWTRYTLTFTYGAGDATRYVFVYQNGAGTANYYCDSIQLEQKVYATPYCDGSLGAAHSWSGAAQASTSSRTAGRLSCAGVAIPTTGSLALWMSTSALMSQNGNFRWLADGGYTAGVLAEVTDQDVLTVFVGGSSQCTYQLTDNNFAPNTWHFIVVTWDSTAASTKLYLDGAQVGATGAYAAPVDDAGGWDVGHWNGTAQWPGWIDSLAVLNYALSVSQVATLYAATLAADQKPRWCNVIAEEVKAFAIAGEETDQGVVSTLAVDGDVRWRSRDGASFWRVIAAASSFVVNNDGDDDAYSLIYITPKTAKTGNTWAYKRWIMVKWRANVAATSYPVDICNAGFDTDALTTAKMQADGDDLRVKVDGVEVNRWLDGMDTVTTKVFVNLNFQASQTATMAAIGDTTGTTLTATTDITNWPSTGILYIDTEAITYTGKSNADKTFTGCTRGAKGTAAATHAAAATAYWIQHDVWILYGNAGASAPVVDDNYKPIFELNNSTNTSWVFNMYGENDGLRTAAWVFASVAYGAGWYTNNHATDVDPWDEIGIITSTAREGYFYLYNPCGIVGVSFTSGEKYSQSKAYFEASIRTGFPGAAWTTQYTIPAPSVDITWEAWASGVLSFASSPYVGMQAYGNAGELFGKLHYVEAGNCVVTLNSAYTPVVAIGAEQSNYDLAVTLTNSTTGDAIQIALTMQLGQTLEINTDAKTITLLADNSRQMQALTLTGGARRDWLRLAAGNNTLMWSDTGTVSVEVEVLFDRRYFE